MEMVRGLPGKSVVELTPEQAAMFGKLSRPLIREAITEYEKRGMQNAREIVEAIGELRPILLPFSRI